MLVCNWGQLMGIAQAACAFLPSQTPSAATSECHQHPAAAVPAPRKTPGTPEERHEVIFVQLQREEGSPGAPSSLLAKLTSIAFPGRHVL